MQPPVLALDLSERTILVTGATSGIGRATCSLLADLGARVILVARRADRLSETAKILSGSDHGIEPCDLASETGNLPQWMSELATRYGPLNGIVHCAGIHQTAPLVVSKHVDYERLYRLNVVAAAMLIRGLRQKAVRGNQVSAVLISSVAGLTGTPCAGAYSASKGALNALARSLAIELAPEGIRVNTIAPGFVETAMTDQIGRMLTEDQLAQIRDQHPLGLGNPRDVANAVVFLLSDWSRWITGTTFVVDGGYSAR